MAVETKYGSRFMNDIANGKLTERAFLNGEVKTVIETVEVAAGAEATSKYYLGKLPSNAVIVPGLSKVYFDDLATTGTPTIDVGLEGAGITDDDNCLADGIDVATAAGSADIYGGDISKIGARAWALVAGQSVDPIEEFDVVVTLKDATVDSGGTVSVVIAYVN